MSTQHLTYFKVENFKRFDSLELTDIGQFNLIVGDNNVGKTSLLEALVFSLDQITCLKNFHKTQFLRGIAIIPTYEYNLNGLIGNIFYPEENFIKYIIKDLNKTFRIDAKFENSASYIEINYLDPNSTNITIYYNDNNINFRGQISPDGRHLKFVSSEEEKPQVVGLYSHAINQNFDQIDLPLITTSIPNSQSLSKSYFNQVGISRLKKSGLIENMKFLLPDIEDFEVRKIGGEDHLLIGLKGKDELMPISTFGESVTRATQILLEIARFNGKRLMIDEIDTGIHFSRLKDFMKDLFQVAATDEVQLFLTTHSLECQQAFAEVFDDPEMLQYKKNARQFSLFENKEGKIISSLRSIEQLQNALEIGFETRGGKYP